MSSSKQKDTLKSVSFCLGSAAQRAAPPVSFNCSGEVNSPCAKVFAFGENACTAQRRRRPEGRIFYAVNIQIEAQLQKSPMQMRSGLLRGIGRAATGRGRSKRRCAGLRFGFGRKPGGIGIYSALMIQNEMQLLSQLHFVLSLGGPEALLPFHKKPARASPRPVFCPKGLVRRGEIWYNR